MHEQYKKFNKEKETGNLNLNRNTGVEKYNGWIEEFKREFQKQAQLCRGKNKWSRRQDIWNYPSGKKKNKSKEGWRKAMGLMRHDQCVCMCVCISISGIPIFWEFQKEKRKAQNVYLKKCV